jgi:hypothetical protein
MRVLGHADEPMTRVVASVAHEEKVEASEG